MLHLQTTFTSGIRIESLAKIYLLEYNPAPTVSKFLYYTSTQTERIDNKCPLTKNTKANFIQILIYRKRGSIFYEKKSQLGRKPSF